MMFSQLLLLSVLGLATAGSHFRPAEEPTCGDPRCVREAACVNNKCVCPLGTKGDVTVKCVPKDHNLCLVTNNWRINGFGKNNFVRYVYPCATTLANFSVMPDTTNTSFTHQQCNFEVHGVPYADTRDMLIEGAKVKITLVSSDNDTTLGMPFGPDNVVTMTFDISQHGIFRHTEETNMTSGMTKNASTVTWGGLTVTHGFDFNTHLTTLTVPECSTTLTVRPYVKTTGHHFLSYTPAIAVHTGKDAVWGGPAHAADTTLCGAPSDLPLTLALEAETLNMWSHRDVAILRGLEGSTSLHFPGMNENTTADTECKTRAEEFMTCPYERRLMAVRHCAPMLTCWSYRTCLLDHAFHGHVTSLASAWGHCLNFYCTGSMESCHVLRPLLNRHCAGSRLKEVKMEINDFCAA